MWKSYRNSADKKGGRIGQQGRLLIPEVSVQLSRVGDPGGGETQSWIGVGIG